MHVTEIYIIGVNGS